MQQEKMAVRVLFPLPSKNVGISHICLSVSRNMRSEALDLQLYTPRVSMGRVKEAFVSATIPRIGSVLPYKWVREWVAGATERRFLKSISPGNVAYLWSDCSLNLFKELKKAGALVVREKYNTHMKTARRILDDAYARVGLRPGHAISDAWIAREQEQLSLADAICCPSPMVEDSMLEHGINRDKLIASSYGWSPERFAQPAHSSRAGKEFTVIFVGSICIRKGSHLLLDAWARSKVKGRLLMVGAVEPALAEKYRDVLNRKDVTVTGFLSDPGPMFLEGDVFAFPSLEEGDPLVSYEAAAHGLPMLVSPMGAGRGAKHGVHGEVLDPYNGDAWVDALQRLSQDAELRRQYGMTAKKEAQEYTWQRVGQRLSENLRKHFAHTKMNGHAMAAATV